MTGQMLIKIEKVLMEERPDMLLVFATPTRPWPVL